MPTYLKPIIYLNSVHQPMGTDEFIDPVTIPLSATPANQLRASPDGLYVGPILGLATYYVGSSGVDGSPNDGTKTLPYKTLDYCLQQLTTLTLTSTVVIALKAGETFTMPNSVNNYGNITFAFWGDPQYGDFDGPQITGPSGSILPEYMADLLRPTIVPMFQSGSTGTTGVVCLENPNGGPTTVQFRGVQLNILGGVHVSGAVDFVNSINNAQTNVIVRGSIINITDPASLFGFFGIEASCRPCFLYQYCSQFLVVGIKVSDSSSTPNLLARKQFIKFYPDFLGNYQSGLDLLGGTALLNLNWTDVPSISNAPNAGKTNLGTFPVLTDPSFGLANYFFNLTRDQQARPLNVVSGRLF
jgi:hypothetical protein